jgi:hypothetical protein
MNENSAKVNKKIENKLKIPFLRKVFNIIKRYNINN